MSFECPREASSERPAMSGKEGNKVHILEGFVMLFKVEGSDQRNAGFRAVNPRKSTCTLESQRIFRVKILYIGIVRDWDGAGDPSVLLMFKWCTATESVPWENGV